MAVLHAKYMMERDAICCAHVDEIINKKNNILVTFIINLLFVVSLIIKDQTTNITRFICQSIHNAAQHNRMLVEQLLSEKRDMAREKQEAIDALATRHRDAITDLCQRHSERMS